MEKPDAVNEREWRQLIKFFANKQAHAKALIDLWA